MSSNYQRNKAFIDQYRKELKSMLDDITDIDIKVLNRAVNEGVADVKRNTPVDTGYMRRSWSATPTLKTREGVTKQLINVMDYASYVNYGHRIVTRSGETVGFARGKFMLEKAINKVDKALLKEFRKEVERVNSRHAR